MLSLTAGQKVYGNSTVTNISYSFEGTLTTGITITEGIVAQGFFNTTKLLYTATSAADLGLTFSNTNQAQTTVFTIYVDGTLATDVFFQATLETDWKAVFDGQWKIYDENGLEIVSPVTVTATDLDIRNLVFATDKVDASGTVLGAGTNNIGSVKLTDGTDVALVTATGEQNVIATAQPGVDIGDVTINNGAGGSAVNIQDGGNSITVDGAVTVSSTNLDIRDLVFATDKVDVSGSAIKFQDSANLDAFSRIRISEPGYVFDANFQYDLQPLLFDPVTALSGATITHDSTNRNALMTFSSTPTGGRAYMQSYEWFRYQAGRSQLILTTFNFIATSANTLKFVGYGDGNNGIQLELNGSTLQLSLYSDTAKGDETVSQASWNLDTLDGLGTSGLTLDVTKTQIFIVDLQWLGVGRVRCGFDIGGTIVYCHEFLNANSQTVAYMQTANLPVRVGMTCSGTVSTTMRFICCSVITEGGETDIGGFNFSQEGTGTAANGSQTHILAVRPKTTFNSIANRTKFVLDSVEVMNTGSNPLKWELVIGQAISGTTTFTDVNATYSGFEYNTAGTISGSPAIVIATGYTPGGASVKTSTSFKLGTKYPITLDSGGAVRILGTIGVICTAYTGTSTVRISLNWKEIR